MLLVVGRHDLPDAHRKVQDHQRPGVEMVIDIHQAHPVAGRIVVLKHDFGQIALAIDLHELLQLSDLGGDKGLKACVVFASRASRESSGCRSSSSRPFQ